MFYGSFSRSLLHVFSSPPTWGWLPRHAITSIPSVSMTEYKCWNAYILVWLFSTILNVNSSIIPVVLYFTSSTHQFSTVLHTFLPPCTNVLFNPSIIHFEFCIFALTIFVTVGVASTSPLWPLMAFSFLAPNIALYTQLFVFLHLVCSFPTEGQHTSWERFSCDVLHLSLRFPLMFKLSPRWSTLCVITSCSSLIKRHCSSENSP